MWSYILIFIGISVSTILMLYLDSRLFDKPKTKTIYIKAIVMNSIITFATISLLTWLSPTKNMKDIIQTAGSSVSKIGSGAQTSFVSQIGEEMLSGDAPF